MPTVRQRRIAAKLVEAMASKEPIFLKDLAMSVGYNRSTSTDHQNLIVGSEGVRTALKEDFGFSTDAAKNVIAEILNKAEAKHRDRLTAADMMLKVTGGYAPEKKVQLNVGEISSDTSKLMLEYEEKLKQQLLQ